LLKEDFQMLRELIECAEKLQIYFLKRELEDAPHMRSPYGGHGSAERDERTTCHTEKPSGDGGDEADGT